MKRPVLLLIVFVFFGSNVYSQANCANPLRLNVCPEVTLYNQTNEGMLDDALPHINALGEDLVYEINVSDNITLLHVSLVNVTGAYQMTIIKAACNVNVMNVMNIRNGYPGTTNYSFVVTPLGKYFLWIDAPDTITFSASFGADSLIYTPPSGPRGLLQFDNTCASPAFNSAKPFFEVIYNGFYQTNPMTLSPLFVTGELCIKTFFKNVSGVEGIRIFDFIFNQSGYTALSAPSIIPGFYNSGNWMMTPLNSGFRYYFSDSLGIGRGDRTGSPDTCLGYEFCFQVTPLSNDPQLTNVEVTAYSDGHGSAGSGWWRSGCCPGLNPNCNLGSLTGGSVSAFAFSFDDPGGFLPVEFTDFRALNEDGKVYLHWITSSEINNDFFSVQRSNDGVIWKELGVVQGAGNSTVQNTYSFIDNAALGGLNYYRIEQTDFDGHKNYSEVIRIMIDIAKAPVIYPNPAGSSFTLDADNITIAKCLLYDQLGRQVQIPSEMSNGKILFDVSEIVSGMYLLKIFDEGKNVLTRKVLIKN